MRRKIKLGLHLFGLLIAIGVGVYFGFVAHGLGVGERITIAAGIVTAMLTALGKAFPTVDAHVDNLIPDDERSKDSGCARVVLLAALALIAWLALPHAAKADGDHPSAPGIATDGDHPATGLGCVDSANTYCVVWNQAVAWQLNLKDFNVKQGAVLLGLSLHHQFGSLPLAIGPYAGLGMSDKGKSYQGCIGLSITNWGLVCLGAQRINFDAGGTAWQGVVSFAVQATAGSTPH